MLRAAGLPVVEARPVNDASGAVAAADALGYPVAVKADVTGLAHKTEIGGVRLGLANADAVRSAADKLLRDVPTFITGERRLRGLLIEPMAGPGVELIVGLVRDPQYGPAVIVGLGGMLAEVLDDTAIALAPINKPEVLLLLDGLRGAALLRGVRGRAPVDLDAAADVVVRLADFGLARPDVLEVDLNPVIVSTSGALAVDALVVLAGGAT
jgi:acetyl-CoA synthetase